MMRFIGVVFLLQLSLTLRAQVVNSLSKNQTGFYTHALDSVLRIIKEEKMLRTIFLVGNECSKQYLPDTLQGVAIKWMSESSKKNRKRHREHKGKEDEAIVMLQCLSIIRDEVTVSVMTPRRGDWLYVFKYYYQPATQDYKLKVVKKGMKL